MKHMFQLLLFMLVSFCCCFAGMIFTYVISQLLLWWLFHTATIFWKIVFPFHAKSFLNSGKMKIIHIFVSPLEFYFQYFQLSSQSPNLEWICKMNTKILQPHFGITCSCQEGWDIFLADSLRFCALDLI